MGRDAFASEVIDANSHFGLWGRPISLGSVELPRRASSAPAPTAMLAGFVIKVSTSRIIRLFAHRHKSFAKERDEDSQIKAIPRKGETREDLAS